MIGQGSPLLSWRLDSGRRLKWIFTVTVLLCVCAPVGWIEAVSAPLSGAADVSDVDENADSVEIRLRLSWGGGEARRWAGRVWLTSGTMRDVQSLGLDSAASGLVVLADQSLHVRPGAPTNYGGVDVTLSARPEAKIMVELVSLDDPNATRVREIDVASLLADPFRDALDSSGNRLVVERAPGDRLPVEFSREHLVFSPGEVFEIGVRANRTDILLQTAVCRLRLNRSYPTVLASTGAVWKDSSTMVIDGDGSSPKQSFSVPIPDREGVYDLEIELSPSSRWPQASLRGRQTTYRRVQIVVIEPRPVPAEDEIQWREVARIDPAEVLPVEPQNSLQFSKASFNKTARLNRREALGNDLRRAVRIDQQPMIELLPGGWQAIPIPVDRMDRPHRVEIEFVADAETAIGVSLLQPDASGQIPLYGFDSGVKVPRDVVDTRQVLGSNRRLTHRVVFWPQNKLPYLLIANRSEKQNATIGVIRVFSGPARLPAAESPNIALVQGPSHPEPPRLSSRSGSIAERSGGRLRKRMAFCESALFPEAFGAHETLDPGVEQRLDDWQTFYVGADRYIQYLKANSYGGAFIAVASDGSSIYPSRLLGASPKQDTGVFFGNGQDPIRKDVLEMLFRMFEREGLTLVPTLALSGPLPAIETDRLAAQQAKNSDDYEVVDLVHASRAQVAQSSLPVAPLERRSADNRVPIYNPLAESVQRNVSEIVGEVARRYRSFHSFEGLAIICRPDTYTLLPGQQWGYDRDTIRRFWQAHPELGALPVDVDAADVRSDLLQRHRADWIEWRAEQMSQGYRHLLERLRASIPGGQLYLAPVDLYRNEELRAALTPSLHADVDFRQQMMHVGFEATTFSEIEALHLLKPQWMNFGQSSVVNRVELGLKSNRLADDFFRDARSPGDLVIHRSSWAHFAQLEARDIFGPSTSPLMRLQPLTPAGVANCQPFVDALRVSDSQLMVDGGLLPLWGQQAELGELLAVYSRLPAKQFLDVPLGPSRDEAAMGLSKDSLPVVVRQLKTDGQCWCYAVNASPWPIHVELNVDPATVPAASDMTGALRSLARPSLSEESFSAVLEGEKWVIRFVIQPMSLVGGVSGIPLAIENYRFELPEHAADRLRKRVYRLQAKLVKSANVQPLPVLREGGFESLGQPTLATWDVGQQSSEQIQLSSTGGYLSQACLRMKNESETPVWIRSHAIETTETGRLSISVWLRTDTPEVQPPLRLAVEGTLGGSSYYRFGSIGGLSPDSKANQVTNQWQRFAVHFDDLPLEELTDLRIGFDLMGPGEVQVDQVEVFDRWFDERDTRAITQRLAGCGSLLAHPMMLESCRLLLDSYWLQFLDEHFEDLVPGGGSSVTAGSELDVPSSEENPGPESQPVLGSQSESKSRFRRLRRLGGKRKSKTR